MAKNDKPENPDGAVTEARPSPLDRRRSQQLARSYRGMSFADARAAAQQDHSVVSAAEAGLGYRLIEHKDDKDHLVGVELMILPGWQVNDSEKIPGRHFTSCYVKTAMPVPQLQGGTEFVLNDGSTGIAQQLADLRQRCIELEQEDPVVYCKRGLIRSEYDIMDDVLDDLGQPIIDRVTNKPKRTPRLDPVTQLPLGRGVTYYLDTSA